MKWCRTSSGVETKDELKPDDAGREDGKVVGLIRCDKMMWQQADVVDLSLPF